MSSKAKIFKPPGRPCSPRKFFARLYGHLETSKEGKEQCIKSASEKSSTVNRLHDRTGLCDEEVTEIEQRLSDDEPDIQICEPEVVCSKRPQEGERRPEKSPSLPTRSLPILPHRFFPRGATHSTNLTQLSYQNSIQHFHGLPIHGKPDLHLHGFSAFRK